MNKVRQSKLNVVFVKKLDLSGAVFDT